MTHSPTMPASEAGPGGQLPAAELVIVTLARVVINAAIRMIYPFLPAISRGLGVSPGAARVLVGARSAAGFAGPLFGPLSDRLGRRAVMLLGLALLTLALLLVLLLPGFGAALLAFALIGLAKVIYDPAMQAYVGDRVPYHRRGLAIGVTELAWSGALLVGAPLAGFAIQRFGWASPFGGLAALSTLSFLGMLAFLRRDAGLPARSGRGPARGWRLRGQPAALGALGFTLLLGMGNEMFLVVYGEWMESAFGLRVAALGLLTAVIGGAELSGELVVVTASDRLGKRRVALAGVALSTLAYVGLPRLGVLGLPVALGMLFVMFVGFESAFVASLPLVSELLPAARGTMMAANLAAMAAGRVSGALLGGWLWSRGGLALNGAGAGAVSLLALLLMLTLVSEVPAQAGQVPDVARRPPYI